MTKSHGKTKRRLTNAEEKLIRAALDREHHERRLQQAYERMRFWMKEKSPLLVMVVNECQGIIRHAKFLGVEPTDYSAKAQSQEGK